MTPTRRITSIPSVAVMAVAFTAPAQAQPVSGIVKSVDLAVGVVYFTDGRMVHLDPSAEILVNGKKLTLREIRNGDRVDIAQSAGAKDRSQAREQTQNRPQAIALPAHPPVDAIGTIASIDRQRGTITLSDGRMVIVGLGVGSVATAAAAQCCLACSPRRA